TCNSSSFAAGGWATAVLDDELLEDELLKELDDEELLAEAARSSDSAKERIKSVPTSFFAASHSAALSSSCNDVRSSSPKFPFTYVLSFIHWQVVSTLCPAPVARLPKKTSFVTE